MLSSGYFVLLLLTFFSQLLPVLYPSVLRNHHWKRRQVRLTLRVLMKLTTK